MGGSSICCCCCTEGSSLAMRSPLECRKDATHFCQIRMLSSSLLLLSLMAVMFALIIVAVSWFLMFVDILLFVIVLATKLCGFIFVFDVAVFDLVRLTFWVTHRRFQNLKHCCFAPAGETSS